jgi:hypothetical protein
MFRYFDLSRGTLLPTEPASFVSQTAPRAHSFRTAVDLLAKSDFDPADRDKTFDRMRLIKKVQGDDLIRIKP